MTATETSPAGCSHLTFAAWLITIGMIAGLLGCLWHRPLVTRTTGTIVASDASVTGRDVRLLTYEYVVDGIHHRGQRYLFVGGRYAGMYRINSSFPVYYVTVHPEESYAPNFPIVSPLIIFGVTFVVSGVTIILFGWRGWHLTRRYS